MPSRKPKPASANVRRLFDEAVERGRQLGPPFTNFERDPDYRLLARMFPCIDTAPAATCDALILLRGSSYGEAAREIQRFLRAQQCHGAAA